jgi:hypothetical protein
VDESNEDHVHAEDLSTGEKPSVVLMAGSNISGKRLNTGRSLGAGDGMGIRGSVWLELFEYRYHGCRSDPCITAMMPVVLYTTYTYGTPPHITVLCQRVCEMCRVVDKAEAARLARLCPLPPCSHSLLTPIVPLTCLPVYFLHLYLRCSNNSSGPSSSTSSQASGPA